MLALMKRKEELLRLLKTFEQAECKDIYKVLKEELAEIALVEKTKMLGKEYALAKSSNPLLDMGTLTLNTLQT